MALKDFDVKLFITGTTRALPPCMVLEEAKADYELVVVDIRKKDRPAELVAFNPQGRLPALKDGEVAIDQSVAILLYLADKFDLLLPKSEPARSETLRALMVSSTDIMNGHGSIFRLMRRDDGDYSRLISDYRQRLLGDISRCNDVLAGQRYLAGDISIADLMLYTIVGQYDRAALQRNRFDALISWIDLIRARPSVQMAESKCAYMYDVSGILGQEVLNHVTAMESFRPVASTALRD
ncbi:glutathione S-transferase family protein [Mesorhizobium sp.]|uniref:glutathione S-transferase family protein n=1 Tax=Mesorhizobium sp. TaxID=1871066 RepID=UPI0025C2C844|nr:glutathione S-transferase family protein [Mesorhizobium sp.]